MTEHKIAEALGLNLVKYKRVGRDYHPVLMKERGWFWRKVDGKALCFPGRCIVRTNKQLEAWLTSPAGEKAVRDGVRKLWMTNGQTITVHYYVNGNVHIRLNNNFGFILRGFQSDTEAEAFAVALIWLAERGD